MRDVHGSPVYSISTSWSQEPVFFTNDNKVWPICSVQRLSPSFCVCLPLCTEQCCPCPRETREFRRTGMAHHARWRTEWILVCDSLFMQSFQAVFDTRVQHLAVWSSSRWQGLLKCTKWTLLYGKSPLQCPHACNDHCVRFLGMKIIYTPKPSTKFEIYVVSGAEEN